MFDPVILPVVVKLFTWVWHATVEDISLPTIKDLLASAVLLIPPKIPEQVPVMQLLFPPPITDVPPTIVFEYPPETVP